MDAVKDEVINVFLGFVSEKAKPCVSQAIDYTLLIGLLALQFFRCRTDITEIGNGEVSLSNVTYVSCSAEHSYYIITGLDSTINFLTLGAICIMVLFGITSAFFIWIHAFCCNAKNLRIKPVMEKVYKCTDRMVFIDTIIEIPISFLIAPAFTIALWAFVAASLIGLYFITRMYTENLPQDDVNSIAVFNTSAVLVALALYKLTGEISQYWVSYKSSIMCTSDPKLQKLQQKADEREADEENKKGKVGVDDKEDAKDGYEEPDVI